MNAVEDLARKLIDWSQRKSAHLRAVAEQAKEGTTFLMGDTEVKATSREALFFRMGVEAALNEIGTLPISIKAGKTKSKRTS